MSSNTSLPSPRILIIGGGMYVTGIGIEGSSGTIGPAVISYLANHHPDAQLGILTTNIPSSRKAAFVLQNLALEHHCSLNIKAFDNPDSAYVELDPNIVIISTPDHTHHELAKRSILHNCHTLVVKPLTDSYETSYELSELVKSKNVLGCVEFHKRFDESNLYLKSCVNDKKLGELQYAYIDYSQRRQIPLDVFKKWSENTNIFQYLGVHYVDLLGWLTGFQPLSVSSIGHKGLLVSQGINTYDSILTTIKWRTKNKTPFTSVHFSSWIDPNTNTCMSTQSSS